MVRAEEREQIVLPQVIEASLVTLVQGVEKNVLSHVGQFNACDLWFKVTPDWEPVVTLKLFARIAGGRVLLATKRLDETHRFTDDGYTSGLAFSLRGRPLEGLELNALCSDGSLANGQFMLSTWTGSEAPSFSAGVLQSESNVRVTDWTSAFGSVAAPVYVRPTRAERAAYAVTSGNVAQATTTANNVRWLLSLFNSSSAKRAEIHRIVVTYHGGTTGHVSFQVVPTTAQGSGTGTATRPTQALDPSDPASALSALTGTFTTAPAVVQTSGVDHELLRFPGKADRNAMFEWSAGESGKPIVLPAAQAKGIGIRLVNEIALGAASSVVAAATVHWVEI